MKKVVNTVNAPAAIGPYSQGTVHGNTLYVSGQLPIDPATGELVAGDIAVQTTRAMENLKAIIEAAGGKMEDVLKTTILLTDLANFVAVNGAYGAFFPDAPPARICYQVTALPKGAEVEIDAIVGL